MAVALSDGMRAFLGSNPTVDATMAQSRHTGAVNEFVERCGAGKFELYGQDTPEVIAKRCDHAPRQAEPGKRPVLPKYRNARQEWQCLSCPSNPKKSEFARHSSEIHVKDPARAFFCPHCATVIYRVATSPIDEHMATHYEFPNAQDPDSRAAAILCSPNPAIISRLTQDVLLRLAMEDQAKISDACARGDEILATLPAEYIDGLAIRGLRIPHSLGHADLKKMGKGDLVNHIVSLRQAVRACKAASAKAENVQAALDWLALARRP